MRRKWMRTFSVLLIVCLLVSDNSLLDWKTTAYATEDTEGALTEDTVGSGSSSQPEEGKTQAGGSTSGEGEGGDSTGGSGSTGEGGNTGNNENTSESGSTGEGSNTGDNENTSESGSTGDSENPEEDEEDVPEEDEELTEDEIALYDGEADTPAGSKALADVADETAYKDYYKTGITYYIAKAEDFLLLQKLTQSYDFEDISFQIGTTGSEKVWKISGISGFTGFGSADHPFRGKMSCYYDSGFQFELDKPLFAYLGEGAEIYQFDFTCVDGASAAIAKNIQVSSENTDEIKIHDIDITGVIKNTGENVGIIAGSIGDNAKIYITNINSGINNITGNNAGGIAGSLGDNVTITAENSSWTAANVTGTAAAGGYFGVVTGSYTWNTSELTLCKDFTVQNGDYAGQFAGKLSKGTGDSTLTVTGDDTITIDAKVNGGQTVGGLLGFCEEGTTLEVAKPLTINGTVTASRGQGSAGGLLGKVSTKITIKLDTYTGNATIETNNNNKGYAGGLFGSITSDFTLKSSDIAIGGYIRYATGAGGFAGRIEGVNFCVPAVTVSATVYSSNHVGGVVGYVNNSKVMVKNPTVKGSLTGETATGGIVGTVQNGSTPSALALDGTVSVQPGSLSGGSCGALVGSQSESLIYLTGVAGKVDGASQLDLNDVAKNLEEIGQYGGVFRNQAEGDQKLIGGDGSLEQLGTVKGYAVSGSGSTWTLKGTAGMETLAIALNTQGNFGMEAFGSSSPNQSGIPALLSGAYTLDGDADISYETTGIITVNRNDKEKDDADKKYLFQGSLKGVSGSTTITQNSRGKQNRTGIFSTLGGTTSFSDLIITGTIENAKGTGGIAYQSKGAGMTLSGVQMEKTFDNNSDTIGGVLAKESSDTLFTVTASNVTLASVINAGNVNEYSGFITQMENAKVALDGITLGGKLTTTSGGNCGGFLGHTWQKMQGSMKKVTVASEGAAIDSKGSTGALLFATDTTEEQYLTLEQVDLKGLTMRTGAKSAFLAAYGQALAANVVDYSCKGATVDTAGEFDEIVYCTKDGDYTGIVSLHDSTKKHDSTKSFPKYCYTNQATYNQSPKTNQLTVYYYDLFQTINADGTINHAGGAASQITSHELDTPEKMLIWSAVHNATSTPKSVFRKCFNENDYGNESYTLKGNLDMGNVSFYPASTVKSASLTGANDATVKFHADQMNSTMGQHQGLHAGLLYNPTGGVTAKDFTLEGTVANLDGNNSGALISGTLTGGGTFENLTLKNLWVRDYQKTGKEEDGLLIAKIEAGTGTQTTTVDVTFNGISMTGYTNANTGVNGKKAAAALIGKAGDSNVTNLKLQFRNMQIADDADASQASQKHNGDVLAFASFLYDYNFATNSDQNIGRGLYTFNEEEAGKKVTWGAELDSLTEYWVYEGTDPHKKVKDDRKNVITNAENGYYKPYVYQTQQIEVNPKTGDLLKGCGTYEDPYIIESSQQFLTLYRYLSMKNGEKSDFFNDWKVNKVGSNETFCTGSSHTTQYAFNSTDTFPTTAQRELSSAYYRLAADIDLSGITSGTYKVIADSFTGFGTSEIPFTGVWYGIGTDNKIHKITLPSKTSSQAYTVYGFIQYAKGAVVKDMKIDIPTGGTAATRTMIANGGAAGGVMGCILGGDNVIDHVEITGEFSLQAHSGTITFAAAGAYAGMVKRGGLILRNVALKDALGAFKIYGDNGTEIAGTTKNYTTYFAGALCGKVEDGYVLYEGDKNSTSAIWNKDVKAGSGNLSLIPYYDIVNGAYLDAQFKDSPATITEPKAGQITVTLPNAAALQVMSMALNAGALNTMSNDTKVNYGYTELSKSRKAKYDKIGACSNAGERDYQAAVRYDNKVTYPYLYRYLGINEGNYQAYILGNASILNTAGKINNTAYHTTWKLAENKTYDLALFGQAFRGIGALYDVSCSTFRGNFDGNGSTVKYALQGLALDYTKNTTVGTAFPVSSGRRGLFNTLTGYKDESCYEPAGFTIQNLKLAGSIKIAGYAVLTVDAGGVAAYVNNARVTLSNIEVTEDFQINAGDYNKYDYNNEKHSTGGLIGRVVNNKQNLTIRNCKVSGTAGKPVSLTSLSHIGGFIGYVDLGSTDGELLIENTETDAAIDNLKLSSTNEVAGAVVGYMLRGKLTIRGTANKPVTVQNTTVQGWWNVGGIVGETKDGVLVTGTYLTVKDTTLTSRKATGGIIGEYGAYTAGTGSTLEHVKITDVKVQEASASDTATYDSENGQGGVVGKCRGYLTLKDITVSTAEPTDSSKECKIAAVANNRVDVDGREKGVGGLAGAVTSKAKLTLNNCTVSNITVAAEKGNAKTTNMNFPVSAGGAVGYSTGTILVDGTLKTEKVTVTTYADRVALGDKTREQVKHFSAGGVVGCLRGKLITTSNDYVSTITAESNTVTGMYAGGFAGTVASYDSSDLPIKLQGKAGSKLVDGGTVTGGQAAGGLFGQLGMNTGSLYLNPEKGTTPLVVSGVIVSGMDAGGVAGSISASKDTRIENVQVEGCTITASIPKNGDTLVAGGSAAGGLIGACTLTGDLKLYNSRLDTNKILYQTDNTTLQDKECGSEENFLSVGGVIGTVRSNAGTGTIQADNLVLSADNQVGVRQGADENGKVQLIQKKDSSYQLADLAAPTGKTNQEALNNLVDSYGLFVGTVIGTLNSTNITINMMNLQLSQDNLPVVDVGRTGSQSSYAYRQNCHILYGDKKSDTAQGNLARMKQEVENSSGTYDNTTDISKLLSFYRLNQVGDWGTGNTPQTPEEIWKDVYPLTLDINGGKKEIPILVCKPGARSLNETITALSDIMTNVSGLSSSKMDILTVTATPKKWDVTKTDAKGYNGEDADSGVKSHIAVTKSGSGYTFAYLDSTTGSGEELFDQYDKAKNTLTYTELTYTYHWSDGSGEHKRVYVLPIFVEEPLQVDVKMSIQAGRVNSVEAMKNASKDRVVMANDSDSTLLLEYTYGKARKSYAKTMPKKIWMTEGTAGSPRKYSEGTKLLLIDVTGGNKPYYYTVSDRTGDQISFMDFTDSAGSPYQEKLINREDFEGTEQFLLQTIRGDNQAKEKTMYDIHTGICDLDGELQNKIQGTLEDKIEVDSIPGITITLITSDHKTNVEGKLTANGELVYTMQFSITAEQAYWQKENTIDSANNNKYLDLACYLMDAEEKERVPLPAGTNFQYRLEDGSSYSDLQMIPDRSGIYYYKAVRDKYDKEDSKFLIRGVDENGKTVGVTKDTTLSLQVKFKLPGELTGLSDSHYMACIDLLRTDDPDYPSGYEDALGKYRKDLDATVVPDIGFAVQVAEADWEKLGINTYESLDQIYEIPFTVQMDFREILRYASGEELLKQWAAKDYCMTFEIFNKAKDKTYGTTPFQDSKSFTGPNGKQPVETMQIRMAGGENTWMWDGSAYAAVDAGSYADSKQGELTMKYRFSKDQLEKTKNGDPITLTGTLRVNGKSLKELKTQEDFEKYLTNYRMNASLKITEASDSLPTGNVDTYDYFVYTITRLKTDM